MSKNKGFDGNVHKPGAAVAGTAAGDSLEKLCELVELETVNNGAVLECLAELKLLVAANNDAVALAEILLALQAVCDKLLAQADQNAELIAELQALCDKILETNAALEALCEKIEQGNAEQLACLEDIKLELAAIIAELGLVCTKLEGIQDTLDSVICPKPQCAAEGSAPVTYTNTDEATEMTVSVGSEGDVKIGSGGGDGSDSEITQYITNCLAAGNDVQWEATGFDGESASGTMLSEAETNPFPGFYNDSVNAAPSVVFKVATMTATCLETVEEAGVTLKTYDQCTAEQIAALCEKLDGPKPTIEECCTGGATETTAKCANISSTWTSMSLGDFDTCTASFGGIDLPNDNYEYADFEALILSVGGTIGPNPNNPDQYTICVPDGFSTCYSRACFKDRIGQLTRACVVATPNTTEEVCTDFQRTWGKFEEPIANILATSLDVQEQTLAKLCEVFTECEDACAESAVIGWCGRPASVADYAYGDIAEATLEEFNAAWEAAGGKTWIAAEDGVSGGECHWFCPAIPGATFTINGEEPGNGNVVVSPNPNAEALGCEAKPVLSTLGCRDDAILAALNAMAEQAELQTAKLCVIEQNSNPAAACSKPVEGLDKEALTLTLSGDVVSNYAEGQSIDLQNANAESCGSATSAGGATYDAANDVTVIPIVECELDEGKEPAVITLAQPVKEVTAVAIKTIKTLTAVKTLTPVKSVTEFTGTTFKSEINAFQIGDKIQLMSAEKEVLGAATIAKVSEANYAISESTVAEADFKRVALAQEVTK